MPNAKDILWFKQQFHTKIEAAIQGTPFTLDMLVALACQETGEIWPILRKRPLTVDQILELCVGDTLDSSGGRGAFPKTKADLVAKPNGEQMFNLARQALVDMAQHIDSYKPAATRANKFCHGFGIFQYDIQFFLEEPDYFLQKRYANFDICLQKCIGELKHALKKIGFQNRTSLTDREMAYVAIAYNTGGFKPSRGLKQGYFDGQKYYGEQIFDFLQLSKSVSLDGGGATQPVQPTSSLYEVQVTNTPLNLRSEPRIDPHNVKVKLPNGHRVRSVSDQQTNGFMEVETDFLGEHYRGYVSANYLRRV